MLKKIAFALAMIWGSATAIADIPPSEPGRVAPDAYVEDIYVQKLQAEATSPELGRATTDSLILNNFSAELLGLYKSIYYFDEPVIDADVFMMAQDWDTKTVKAKTIAQTATSATVEATFHIAGEPRKVTYTLKALKSGWEIDDISTSEGSLRKWVSDAIPPKAP